MPKYKFQNVKPQTSKIMKNIRSKNTAVEILLRKALFKEGFRYRIHYSNLPGKPDIVFVKQKIAIFCDSVFWHGKDWNIKRKKIKHNRDYWIPKIEKTITRDILNTEQLNSMGWYVLRFWDQEINRELPLVLNKIKKAIFVRNRT